MRNSERTGRWLVTALAAALVPAPVSPQDMLQLEAALTLDAAANVRGGVDRAAGWLANLDLTASLDGAAFGWTGGSAALYLLGNAGDTPSLWVGDVQVTNNIEAPRAFRLYEAWVRQSFFEDRLSMLAGLRDLNAEFHVIEHGELFLNSSMGIGAAFAQTGANGPAIFPNSGLAFTVEGRVMDGLRLRGGAFDAVANDPTDPSATDIGISAEEGALLVGEAEVGPGADAWRILVGGYRYTEPVDTDPFDGPGAYEPARDDGAYAILEGYLGSVGETRVYGFLQGGTAAGAIYDVDRAWGGGVVVAGLFGGDDDRFGVAVAATDSRLGVLDEWAWEATWEWEATPWAEVRFDAQWVDFESDREDALILTTRFGIALTR